MLTRGEVEHNGRRGVPTTTLIASGPFGPGMSAARAAAAIARGLDERGAPAADLCPVPSEGKRAGGSKALLDAFGFDSRMRRARAVILAQRRLGEHSLAASAAFEIATRARQAGVPAFAVTGENRLDCFDARILDLQAILEVSSPRALAAAGRKLAQLIYLPEPPARGSGARAP